MSRLFSPNFVEVCLQRQIRQGDNLPCPKCGCTDVAYEDHRRWRLVAVVAGAITVMMLLLDQMVIGQCIAVLAVGAAVGSFSDSAYTCSACGHIWRYRDAIKWAEAIRHDHEAWPDAPHVARPR